MKISEKYIMIGTDPFSDRTNVELEYIDLIFNDFEMGLLDNAYEEDVISIIAPYENPRLKMNNNKMRIDIVSFNHLSNNDYEKIILHPCIMKNHQWELLSKLIKIYNRETKFKDLLDE